MPVVVSMLNCISAVGGAGFLLNNDLLIITGALVDRPAPHPSLHHVPGDEPPRSSRSSPAASGSRAGPWRPTPTMANTAIQAGRGRRTPRRMQERRHHARDTAWRPRRPSMPSPSLTKKLRAKGVNVRFGIHPVAGRLPGHMNVLLSPRPRCPTTSSSRWTRSTTSLADTDVVLVIGANDTVNPAAQRARFQADRRHAGTLHVWGPKDVIVFKRSMATGYAGNRRTRCSSGEHPDAVRRRQGPRRDIIKEPWGLGGDPPLPDLPGSHRR